jgi:thiol peroxidase
MDWEIPSLTIEPQRGCPVVGHSACGAGEGAATLGVRGRLAEVVPFGDVWNEHLGDWTMADVRKGEVTFKGGPIDLVGPRLKAGDKAPDFACVGEGLSVVSLADTGGKTRLFSVVPSLDTPVCNMQTHKFAERLKAIGDKVSAYTISLDLPFAMKRFCTDAQIEGLQNLSDAHNHSFGEHYGVLIQGLPIPLLARAIFVVDPSNTIQYVEYVPEIAQEPNYDAAIQALEKTAG